MLHDPFLNPTFAENSFRVFQFLLFVVSHLLLIFGAATSKLVVILLATNIELKAPGSHFEKKCYVGEGYHFFGESYMFLKRVRDVILY